jgi:hypothetical protein
MRLVLDACPSLAPLTLHSGDSQVARAATRFEQRGLRLGHAVCDLVYERAG